jgi:hypothetical protein
MLKDKEIRGSYKLLQKKKGGDANAKGIDLVRIIAVTKAVFRNAYAHAATLPLNRR